MENIDFGLNLNDIQLAFKDELIPQGTYPIQATQIEYRDNKSGLGKHLLFTFAVTEGLYAGQKIFQQVNIDHSNSQVKEIALKQLKQLLLACGCNGQERLTLALLQGIKGKTCSGYISVQPARNGYGPKNVLRSFSALKQAPELLDDDLPF
jgi:hypothetical protein